MNKKIKTILFTLFVAGLLTVSCSSKDKTGPSSDNGGGTTPPTIPESGTGIDKSFCGYVFAPSADAPFTITANGAPQNITSENDFQLSTKKDDPNLQGHEGGILIKMPKLKELGFTSDVIRIPAKNIVEGSGDNYTIHTAYIIDENPDNLITVELKSSKFKLTMYIEMDITLTKTTKVKDQEPKVETYNLKTTKSTKFWESGVSAPSIEGTPIDPKY